MEEFPGSEWRSTALFRVVGYSLLALAFFDYVNVFIPPRFTNPAWEFQMLGEVVQKSPVPTIGTILVFYGKDDFRKDIEEYILKFLSWASLVAGIAFLLLVPLGINNTLRLNILNNIQINNQLTQRLNQLQQINNSLNQASSKQDLNNLYAALNRQGRTPDIKNPEELKSKLLSDISTAQKTARTQSQAARTSRRIGLLKNSVEWNLGAVICGVSFIFIWKLTDWAR